MACRSIKRSELLPPVARAARGNEIASWEAHTISFLSNVHPESSGWARFSVDSFFLLIDARGRRQTAPSHHRKSTKMKRKEKGRFGASFPQFLPRGVKNHRVITRI